jgi:hypothetical protein
MATPLSVPEDLQGEGGGEVKAEKKTKRSQVLIPVLGGKEAGGGSRR